MTQHYRPDFLRQVGIALFTACGTTTEEAALVADHLVRASLTGHDSHGIVRYAQYIAQALAGEIKPGAALRVVRESAVTAVLDAGLGWGQVAARRAMEMAIEKAWSHGIGIVVVQNCPHAGRMGEYAELAAGQDMIGYIVANSHGGGQSVAPWGGIDRRFTPNPIAFGAPSGHAWPIVIDLTMSALPEGKVRVALHRGEPIPPDCAIDSEGKPTTDPKVFYGPPAGALLPLGGVVGHKGYGLTVMTELLGGILSGAGFSGELMASKGNGLFIQAINIDAFTTLASFTERVQAMIEHVKSSRRLPGVEEILFPGEPEYRTAQRRQREGIPVEPSIWAEIEAAAARVGIALPEVG